MKDLSLLFHPKDMPLPRHAFQWVQSPVIKFYSGSGHKIFDGTGNQHFIGTGNG
jgi:hypothetical protein